MFARPRFALTFTAVGLSALLSACGTSELLSRPATWLTPYRPDVVQGNFISSEQVALLRPGMSRLQVRNLLGTPLVSSLFHGDRWDYVFSLQRRGGETRLYRYSVFFQGDALTRFAGDAMPSESEFVAQIDSRRRLAPVPALEATPAQLKAAEAKAPRKPEASAAPAPALPSNTTYPPLEGERP